MVAKLEEEDIEVILKREDAEFVKDEEITRILRAFKLDAYAVLDILPGCTTKDIRNVFRKKSLLIHPDKTKNEKAPEAFDKLKKAEGELMDEKIRANIDSAIATARRLLIHERGWTVNHPDLDTPEFMDSLRERTRDVLIEDEVERRVRRARLMAEEGRVRQEEEERENERKRKKEAEKKWEATRDERVDGWRKFTGQQVRSSSNNQDGNQGDVPSPPPLKKVKKNKKPKLLG